MVLAYASHQIEQVPDAAHPGPDRIRQRIRDGSNRLADALHQAYRLRDKGDLEGARRLMEDLLKVEVVPLYREQAEILLGELVQHHP